MASSRKRQASQPAGDVEMEDENLDSRTPSGHRRRRIIKDSPAVAGPVFNLVGASGEAPVLANSHGRMQTDRGEGSDGGDLQVDERDAEGETDDEMDISDTERSIRVRGTGDEAAQAKRAGREIDRLPAGAMKEWCQRAYWSARDRHNIELASGQRDPNPVNPYKNLTVAKVVIRAWQTVERERDALDTEDWDDRALPQRDIVWENWWNVWRDFKTAVVAVGRGEGDMSPEALQDECDRYYERAKDLRNDHARHIVPTQGQPARRSYDEFIREQWRLLKLEINKAHAPFVHEAWAHRERQLIHMDDQEPYLSAMQEHGFAVEDAEGGESPRLPAMLPSFGFGSRVTGLQQGDWRHVLQLGKGGQGTADLWARYNQDNVVVDRLVIKQSRYDDPKDRPKSWLNGEIRENYIHRELSQQGHYPSSIVGWRAFAAIEERGWYRVYMNLCAHGDLLNLINRNSRLEGILDAQGGTVSAYIPPSVVWCVFETLVKALCQLRDCIDTGAVHMDIKPQNVFLDSPGNVTGDWPLVSPRLGDFGLTFPLLWALMKRNPLDYRGNGTRYYMAPEQAQYAHEKFDGIRISSRTDVWAVGVTIACMMFRVDRPENKMRFSRAVQPYDDDRTPFDDIDMNVRKETTRYYGKRIFSIVNECCRMDPADRPSPRDLLARIQDLTSRRKDWNRDGDDTPMRQRGLAPGQHLELAQRIFTALAR